MLAILSPSKTLSDDKCPWPDTTQPALIEHSYELFELMRGYDVPGLRKLMHISEQLAQLNAERFAAFEPPLTEEKGTPALYAFRGDCYFHFELNRYTQKDLEYAQGHLRILSGLYGTLRPLDRIHPYRLEMGTKLPTPRGKNLYEYWGSLVVRVLNMSLAAQEEKVLVNLASNEYSSAIQWEKLEGTAVQPVFLDFKNGKYKPITLFAKRARGAMADSIIRERIEDLDTLKAWTRLGYAFSEEEFTQRPKETNVALRPTTSISLSSGQRPAKESTATRLVYLRRREG